MNYGLYSIFLGMRSRQNTLEVQANNIANASTAGFKAERMAYTAVESQFKGTSDKQRLVGGVETSAAIDFASGTLQQTGRDLDVAIEGDGFLQVQTPRGPRFTRAGSLTQNEAGQLVTKNGDLVVGVNGPITIPKGAPVSIGPEGDLSSGSASFDKLKLVRFASPASALMKESDSLFMLSGSETPQIATGSKVIQGSLESSNINSVSEMVAMINNNREFESLQRSLTLLMNDLGKKISGEIGRI